MNRAQSGTRPARGPARTRRRSDELAPAPSRLVAGIDEAGLGPLLGPLTIGWSVLRLPRVGADPWKLLATRVDRAPRRSADGRTRLVVADSKRVFTRNRRGLERLERTVLTFLALLDADGKPPRDPRSFFSGPVAPSAEALDAGPWYGSLPPIPMALDAGGIELGTALLARRLAATGLAFQGAGVRAVPAVELNASFDATGNKGQTTWNYCAEILRHLWEGHGQEGLDVTVDLLGGRRHYGAILARAFPDAGVRTLFELDEHSAYLLDESGRDAARRWEPRRMRVDFRAKGEEASFAVALSSCLAKYTRELAMEGFNRYFGALQADLKPTAGYTTDGRRWLADAEELLAAQGIPRETLVRSR